MNLLYFCIKCYGYEQNSTARCNATIREYSNIPSALIQLHDSEFRLDIVQCRAGLLVESNIAALVAHSEEYNFYR